MIDHKQRELMILLESGIAKTAGELAVIVKGDPLETVATLRQLFEKGLVVKENGVLKTVGGWHIVGPNEAPKTNVTTIKPYDPYLPNKVPDWARKP